jgi:hypothetical protein
MKMFEKAARMKLRVHAPGMILSVEDLWDLPLNSKGKVNLDDIAKAYARKLRSDDEESFVTPKKKDVVAQLCFDILKHIITVKMAERDKAKQVADLKIKRQKIIDAIAGKEEEHLKGASLDDLKKQLDELGSLTEEAA